MQPHPCAREMFLQIAMQLFSKKNQKKRYVCDGTVNNSESNIQMPFQKSFECKNENEKKLSHELKIPSIPAITTEFSQEQMNDFVFDDPKKQMKEV